MRPVNTVIPLLALMALALLWNLDFISVHANRIAPGRGVGLMAALSLGWALTLSGLLLGCAALAWKTPRYGLIMLALALLAVQLPFGLAWAIERHIDGDLPHGRVALGAGFWSLVFLLGLLLIEVRQRVRLPRLWLGVIAATLLLATAWIVAQQWLEPLALLREYAARESQFAAALSSHLALVGGAVGLSLLLGFAIALVISRFPAAQKSSIGMLNAIQTIPSLALFGLLIAPLSYLAARYPLLQTLNIGGIGWAPALLALVAYSLLPIVRNSCVALNDVPPAVIEAAQGMGMSPWQVFVQVRLPLAMPLIIEGVRITTIQAIGLTAVAALIGAGGFGTFIFQGLGQAAMDLVILGALPIIVLALLADALFSLLARRYAGGER
ncbi:ABC transporter permease [Pseudomonas borbori]